MDHLQKSILAVLYFSFLSVIGFSQSLKIVSWNLKDFGQSRDDEEIRMIAQELRGADIVAIQEVVAKHPGGAKAVARLKAELNRMGAKWDARISNPTKSSSSQKSERYAFLWKTSKAKLVGGRPYLIKELEKAVEREPFLIQFEVNQEIITLLNYHACTHTNEFPERGEINSISNWLLEQTFENVVWAGDMNLVIGDRAFHRILSSGYISALDGQKTSLKKSCKSGNYLSRAEDNILMFLRSLSVTYRGVLDFIENGACEDVSWKRNSYSDHLGVEILLE